ncbi:MAG: hypothetical protein M3Z96_11760 [Pseudomonadota bacterium]|nr:hypothetical protein [Pseudomonadota bacterium]
MFGKIVAKFPQDTEQLIGPAAKATADKLAKDKLVGAIPKFFSPSARWANWISLLR